MLPPTYIPLHAVGEHDIATDAEFLAAQEDDFRIAFGSPAVDVGDALPADLEIRLRTFGATGTGSDDRTLDLEYHFPP